MTNLNGMNLHANAGTVLKKKTKNKTGTSFQIVVIGAELSVRPRHSSSG
jgi:hypothetical protein